MNMEAVLILGCFVFSPGGPDECGLATLTPKAPNDNTPEMVREAYCKRSQAVLAREYPGAEITRCEVWIDPNYEPLGGIET